MYQKVWKQDCEKVSKQDLKLGTEGAYASVECYAYMPV